MRVLFQYFQPLNKRMHHLNRHSWVEEEHPFIPGGNYWSWEPLTTVAPKRSPWKAFIKQKQKQKIARDWHHSDTLSSKWQNRHRMFLLLFDSILRLLKTDVERSCQSWQAILKVDIINGNSWHMFRKSWQKMESSHQLNSNQGRSQGQEEM